MGRQRIRLCAVDPPLEGQGWESEYLLRIGRSEDLEVVLNDSSVSRRHAEVVFTEQGWIVRDLGSTNGTFLNGVRVGRADHLLRDNDQLLCGNLKIAVELAQEEVLPGRTALPDLKVEGALQNSWEQALRHVVPEGIDRPQDRERLLALFRIGRDFTASGSLDSLLQSILQDARTILNAQWCGVVLLDAATGQTALRATYPPGRNLSQRAWLCTALSQRALQTGESFLTHHIPGETAPRIGQEGRGGTPSVLCALLRSPRKRLGALYLERGGHQERFGPKDLPLADALAAAVSPGIESLDHFADRERGLFIQVLTTLAETVELRDSYTGGHTQRVTDYALLIGDDLKLSVAERHVLQIGTPLHDIGKIGISDAILYKTGPLTDAEFTVMKSHTWKGAAILEIIPHLAPVIPIVRSHHERWDGTGYPDGLAGRQIPHLARIVAVADAFDAMTTDRPYRSASPPDHAFEEIRKKAAIQFDPDCVNAFLRLRPRLEEIVRQNKLLQETIRPEEIVRAQTVLGPTTLNLNRTNVVPKLTPAILQSRMRKE